MKIKITKSQMGKMAEMTSGFIFKEIRRPSSACDMEWLCNICDLYQGLDKKAERYQPGDNGRISVDIPDSLVPSLADSIQRFALEDIRDSLDDDLPWACEITDIYRQLKGQPGTLSGNEKVLPADNIGTRNGHELKNITEQPVQDVEQEAEQELEIHHLAEEDFMNRPETDEQDCLISEQEFRRQMDMNTFSL